MYHCRFPRDYLRSIHDIGVVDEVGVTLSATQLYDFRNPEERRRWFDIVVALLEYIRSGESHVGYLNKDVVKNMLHKDMEIDSRLTADDVCDGSGTTHDSVGINPLSRRF